MNSNYQQGKQDVKDLKDKTQETAQNIHEKKDQFKDRAQGAFDQTKEELQQPGIWEKTKEVAGDIKDTIVDTAKSAYDSTKDFVSGSNVDQRNIPSDNRNLNQGTNLSGSNLNQGLNKDLNKNRDQKNF
jgi:hypothetical protein